MPTTSRSCLTLAPFAPIAAVEPDWPPLLAARPAATADDHGARTIADSTTVTNTRFTDNLTASHARFNYKGIPLQENSQATSGLYPVAVLHGF